MASRSAWTARAGAWTTSSSSGCGAVSNTRRSTSTLMRLWPKPRLALVAGWTFTTRSVSIRAWVIAHRVRSTRKACGHVDDRRRRPAALPPLPERARKPEKRSPSRPHPHRPQNKQSDSYCRFKKQRRCPSHCTDNDRSRHRNRQGYTLRSASGCLTNGVHLTLLSNPGRLRSALHQEDWYAPSTTYTILRSDIK